MSIEKISPMDTDVQALLLRASTEPVILQAEDGSEFALLPVDDDVLDLLLERNPAFIEECRQIRERMRQGDYFTYEEALRELQIET